MFNDKTETEIPVPIPEGEIDWLEMTKPPKEFSQTQSVHVSYRNVKPMRVSNITETLVP